MRRMVLLLAVLALVASASPALAEHGECHPVGYCENGRLPHFDVLCPYEWVWDDYYQGWWFHQTPGVACNPDQVGWYWWGN